MSLRVRVALALGALAALATLVVGVAGHRATGDRLMAEVDRSLADTVRLVPADRRGQVVSLPPRGPLSVYEVQLLARDGSVRLSSFPVVVDPSPAAGSVVGRTGVAVVETTTVDGVDHRVRTVGVPNGAVQVARSLDEIDRVLTALRNRTVVMVLSVSVAAAAAGWVIAGGVTASLRRLTAAADTVATTGRLDVEVPVSGVDEVGRLGGAFAAMLDALARSRAEQRRLVEDAGHELRTPLTSIRTDIDVLRRYPDLPSEQRVEVLADLHRETEELVVLVDEIVTVATGVAPDEPMVGVDLAAIAIEVAERFERRTARTVTVHLDRSPSDGEVRAQPTAIQRAISNLVDNARKFDASGAPIEVTVGAGRVAVADRGPGIAPEDRDRVFERFHRSVSARTAPGSGLGLAIVAEIVARHGGRVFALGRDGGGAVVGFELPVDEPADTSTVDATTVPNAAATDSPPVPPPDPSPDPSTVWAPPATGPGSSPDS